MSELKGALIDIVEPMAPVAAQQSAHGWLPAVIAVMVLLLVIAAVVWWRKKLPALQAIRRLRALRQKLHAGEQSPHESVLLLALEVRHGLGVKRLRADVLPEKLKSHDHPRWPEYMRELDAMLYQHDAELKVEQVIAFFVQSEYWLRRYGRRSALRKMDV